MSFQQAAQKPFEAPSFTFAHTAIPAAGQAPSVADSGGEPAFQDVQSQAASVQTAPPMQSGAKSRLDKLRKQKILHAPMEIAGNMAKICKFLRKNHIQATSVNYHDTWLKYECDINLNVDQYPKDEQEKLIHNFAQKAIEEYDIFHFHFARSLYPDYRDLPELAKRNKKIIVNFWGSDARSPEWILYQQARYLGYNPPKPYFNTVNQFALLKHLNKYADVMLAASGTPKGMRLRGQIDANLWTLEEKDAILQNSSFQKDPNKTYFVHAPTNNWKKGSRLIIPVLERLKKRGWPIEILFVQQLTLDKAKAVYALADYAVDQVGVGAVGLFGMEMMCWQIPVLTYQIPLFAKIKNHPPVINITADAFEEKIAECIDNKMNGKIDDQGRHSRQWVLENEDINSTFSEYLDMYEQLANDEPVKQYTNKAWYVQEDKFLKGEKSEFFQYMIKSGACKKLDINVDGYDKRLYL